LEFDEHFTDDDKETKFVQITNHTGSLIVVECPAFPKSLQTNMDCHKFALSDKRINQCATVNLVA